jgi:outer membrane lipoprotein-sorting protein
MDPVLDRVRAADPVLPGEFAGLADFDALVLEPSPRPRRRRRLLALPALGAVLAAVVLVPSSAPQAREIVRRASAAVDPSAGILYAQSAAENRNTDGTVDSYGSRRVWVHGTTAMRWLEDNGNEEVYARGEGTTRFDPRTGKVTQHRDVTMVPNDIFRASQLLSDARAGKAIKLAGEESVDGRAAYVLRWDGAEGKGLPDTVHIELTLWVDRETYAPLRYTDHSWGLDRSGKPMDQTYVETVQDFQTLPDTPANRKLLALGVR